MSNHPQALKRHKQSLKRRARNRHYTTQLKGAVKALRTAIDEHQDKDTLEKLYRTAASTLDRVAGKGIIKTETASRRISRLALAMSKVGSESAAQAAPKKKVATKKTTAKKATAKASGARAKKPATAKKATAKKATAKK